MCRLRPLPLSLLLLLAAAPASAQDTGLLAVCSDPDATPQQAARFCNRALEAGGLSPQETARTAANLGAALLAMDRPEQAEDAYDRALAADGSLALAWAGRARAREAQDRTPQAAVDWNRAVGLTPRDPDILTGRGAFRLRAGNFAGALADFESAQRRRPNDMGVAFNRGLALAALGRDAEAERMFTTVLRNDPSDAGAWLNRARLRVSRDRAAALSDLDEAVARAEGWSTPWFERGLLLDAMGRKAAADRDFRRAWELGHRNEFLNARMLELGR